MKKTKRKPKRPRGGASAPCPRCTSPSRVLDTRRGNNGTVTRTRRCNSVECAHTFVTHERRAK